MRKEATLKNSIAGIINRFASLLFVFIVRHYFVQNFDTEFLGFEGFFQNILGLFSLVDLGLGTAIAFDLYDPIHKNEHSQIGSIMNLYKKIYVGIGILIFVMSLMFVPFLLNFINGYTIDGNSIKLYFLIYAFGVAVSYFFSYKRTLLFAYQKNYLVLNVDTLVKIIGSLMQILIIVCMQNYILYLLMIVLMNIISNVLISVITDKGGYYNPHKAETLSNDYKKKLKDHVKALAVTNIAWQGIASTDNIIISSTVGIIELAKNANYATITQAITGITNSVLGGVSASIGDLIAEGNKNKIYEYFYKYCFVYFIVASYACLGVYFVSPDVVAIWVGEKYVFESIPVFLISINLFLNLIFKPLADYQNYSGTFVYYKPYSVVALFINLVVSIIGALTIGISGVFLGTTVTFVFMVYIVTHLVYKYIFKSSSLDYYIKLIKTLIPLFIGFIVLTFVVKSFAIHNVLCDLVVKMTLVTVVYFTLVIILLRNDSNYVFFRELIKKIIQKILPK